MIMPSTKAADGAILRAEGHSRRCSQFEFVAAKRHLSPRRPANCDRRGRQDPYIYSLTRFTKHVECIKNNIYNKKEKL